MSAQTTRNILIAIWVAATGVYLASAVRQKTNLNLSATAGGQYPYLVYASGVADEGLTVHVGDRNRMPLVPSIVSLVYSEDWNAFANSAAWLAVVLSLIALGIVVAIAYTTLPPWLATMLSLTAMFGLFVDKAAFVQAELPFYVLFLLCWVLSLRTVEKPTGLTGMLTGIALGICYLTKASALPLLASLAVFLLARTLIDAFVAAVESEDGGDDREPSTRPSYRACALTLVIATAAFSFTVSPYIRENKNRFDRYFYNVNSQFFMWCDSWQQAKALDDAFDLSSGYPDLPSEQIPSASTYFATHTSEQALGRLTYGFKEMGRMLVRSSFGRYFLAAMVLFAATAIMRFDRILNLIRQHRYAFALSLTTLAGYCVVYAWYVQVAYGDRFLRSLILPAMWVALWAVGRVTHDDQTENVESPTNEVDDEVEDEDEDEQTRVGSQNFAMSTLLPIALCAMIFIDGSWWATTKAHQPTKEFVEFYYNEARQRQIERDVAESSRGFSGVIKLDPDFAPAYLSLGINQLISGKPELAAETLTEAVRLSPDQADAHNSLGSALCQLGNFRDAIPHFERGIEIRPETAVTYYNLGGAYCEVLDFENARRVEQKLKTINPDAASQLRSLIEQYEALQDNHRNSHAEEQEQPHD